MEKNFIRVRSTKDITISCGIAITGCILIALPTATSINILGFFMIFAGILLFLILRTGYKDEDTKVNYCKSERFFSQDQRAELIANIASNPDDIALGEEDKGNAVRLDTYYSKVSGKAYLQVFEYVPYKYESCSKQYEHEISKISKLK